MASINLAPGTQLIVQAQKRRRRLFLISAVVAAAVFLVTAGLMVYLRSLQNQSASVREEIRAVDSEIARMEESANRITSFESRLKDLASLLDNHVSWNPILADIERLLPSDTSLTLIESHLDNGTILVEGKTPDVDKVAVTLASLESQPTRKTVFTKADLGAITREEIKGEGTSVAVSYSFTATLHFDPATLYINK